MANLTVADRQYLEHIFGMSDQRVLNFTNETLANLFRKHDISLFHMYKAYRSSNPTHMMRELWELKSDTLVGQVLSEMLDAYKARCNLGHIRLESKPYEMCRKIAAKLCGKAPDADSATDGEFPDEEFEMPGIQKLPVDPAVAEIIRDRLDEARACLRAGAYLSPILLWGSVLEAVLLGAAQKEQKRFHSSPSSPKRKDGSSKPLHEWSLMELINVASDVGLLKTDAQGFSQVLRDFRNYIHPAKQAASGFAPDRHTARLCLDAFKAALADVAGER